MKDPGSLAQFERLLPLAAEWASQQEERILEEGVPLDQAELEDARAVGVLQVERVRLLQVEAVPVPTHPLLQAAYASVNLFTGAPRGLALRYGIFVRDDCRDDRHLLLHELAHTAQYEKLGGIVAFLRKYLFECATVGYRRSSMEAEATAAAERAVSRKATRFVQPAEQMSQSK